MTTNLEGGNVPRERTIDSAGNIIPRPYGSSRWSTPKRYDCTHSECEDAATLLSAGCPGAPYAHNCCAFHKEGADS